ncbi:hypothetical protein [Streptomyces sp. LN549]|uniref:hypothetical protein n=1 Tax=Streptomyces sp. LN549 TaxID=3112979 RepID=UPI00371F9EEC
MSARTELLALLECVVPLDRARDMVDRHHAEVLAASTLAAAVDALGALPMPTGDVDFRAIEQDRPSTRFTHDCGIPLTRRLDCGHCPHEVCQDCERCPHTCRCASPEDRHDSPLHTDYATPRDLPEIPAQRDQWGQA